MDRQAFEALVRRLEDESQEDPQRYSRRVIWMARMGYGYIGFIITLALGLIVTFALLGLHKPAILAKVGIYWVIPLLGLLKVIGSTLFTRLPAPEGMELEEAEYPELFRAIEEVRAQLDAPQVDAVLLTEELNAAVVENPRFGIIGPATRYLILGLPLLQALSPQEFRAVLAHEFGHLIGSHSRQSGGIYHLRQSWERIRQHFEDRDESPFLFGIFFERFIPRFMAYSFVLARAHEYEADRASARVTSPKIAGQALTRIAFAAQHLNGGFWPAVSKRVSHSPEAPRSLYVELKSWLADPAVKEGDEAAILKKLRRQQTDLVDTHPALTDRLAALGQPLVAMGPTPLSAATFFLGDEAHQRLCETLSQQWWQWNANSWEQGHHRARQEQERLADLQIRAQEEELSLDEHWELAQLLVRNAPFEEAEREFEAILKRWPTQQGARMTLGTRWADRDEARGVPLLEAAIADDIWLTGDAGQTLYAYYERQGDEAMAERWADRLDVWFHDLEEARRERDQLTRDDVLFAHDLIQEEVEEIVEALQSLPGVKEAWLASKAMVHFPDEEPCYVLGVRVRLSFLKREPVVSLSDLGLGDVLPHRALLIVDVSEFGLGWARKKFKGVGGSRVL